MRTTLKKSHLFFAAALLFCHNITAMDSNKMNCDCDTIRRAAGTLIVVQQSFMEYQNMRGTEPLKLVFPAGRCLFNPADLRGDQQKHEGFYTIDGDYSDTLNPHLKGDIFNPELWEYIPDNTVDLTHIEIPGALFLFVGPVEYEREEKDDFLLRRVNKKSKMGGKLFVDLRHSRFSQLPNVDVSLSIEEIKEKIERLTQEDPDFFVDFSFELNNQQLPSCWHKLLGDPEDEIYEVLKIVEMSKMTPPDLQTLERTLDLCNKITNAQFLGDEERSQLEGYHEIISSIIEKIELFGEADKKLKILQERVREKTESLRYEEKAQLQAPYLIFYDKDTRKMILDQYDLLFGKYGFRRVEPVTELYGIINNNQSIPSQFQIVDRTVIYNGMCFTESIAEYEKVQDL